ncbi:hypothetical protein QTP86_021127 [Hemibagrus guttatus]|nr:hypothetical protein QTP86_021127 [Hemibagrus guttatus]
MVCDIITLRGKTKRLSWGESGREAFQKLSPQLSSSVTSIQKYHSLLKWTPPAQVLEWFYPNVKAIPISFTLVPSTLGSSRLPKPIMMWGIESFSPLKQP